LAQADDPETDWYFKECGSGFMIKIESMGSVYKNDADEDLEFVSREIPETGPITM